MANELATRGNNAVAANNAGNPFLQAASDLGGGSEGLTYAAFSGKTGDYTYGADKEELDDGWQGAVNMSTASRGWIAWVEGKVEGEKMVRVLDGAPLLERELPDLGPLDDDDDGWQEQISFEVGAMESGERLLFKNSSKSGLRAFGNLLAAYGKAIQKGQNMGDDGEELHPIVEFSATEFTPKNSKSKKDRAYAPSFKIVDWISESNLLEKFGGEDDASNYEEPEEEKESEVEETVTAVESNTAEEAPVEGGRRRRRF